MILIQYLIIVLLHFKHTFFFKIVYIIKKKTHIEIEIESMSESINSILITPIYYTFDGRVDVIISTYRHKKCLPIVRNESFLSIITIII